MEDKTIGIVVSEIADGVEDQDNGPIHNLDDSRVIELLNGRPSMWVDPRKLDPKKYPRLNPDS